MSKFAPARTIPPVDLADSGRAGRRLPTTAALAKESSATSLRLVDGAKQRPAPQVVEIADCIRPKVSIPAIVEQVTHRWLCGASLRYLRRKYDVPTGNAEATARCGCNRIIDAQRNELARLRALVAEMERRAA